MASVVDSFQCRFEGPKQDLNGFPNEDLLILGLIHWWRSALPGGGTCRWRPMINSTQSRIPELKDPVVQIYGDAAISRLDQEITDPATEKTERVRFLDVLVFYDAGH
ncbi:MAG TPA: hypothetical protein VI756_21625 [Blastocatellia bacterium]